MHSKIAAGSVCTKYVFISICFFFLVESIFQKPSDSCCICVCVYLLFSVLRFLMTSFKERLKVLDFKRYSL